MKRRSLLAGAGAAAAASAAIPFSAAQDQEWPMVDSNVYLGDWPFRTLPHAGVEKLETKLKQLGVTEAWAGSFDALFHRDLDIVNATLAEQCDGTLFRPFGAVNPALPGWQKTIRRIGEEFGMPGIRLHPNYHEYSLDDPRFLSVLESAKERDLAVQIAFRMEDIRTQHPKAAVPDVDVKPLAEAIRSVPGVRVQLLNALRSFRDSLTLERLGQLGVRFDIAMLEGAEGVRNLLDQAPNAGLVFGSYAPFFYPESALLKLRESVLTPAELASITSGKV